MNFVTVTCDSCGKSVETPNAHAPDRELDCGCCPEDHDHAGLGCRTVTITVRAFIGGSAGMNS